ncbi:toxin secretion ATP binding protein [Legionella gratiana]|uniref:Toxin secretion ATP binding protein n=1 Tax=Legionella gratiana TaxID=45066 RepID=A0A378J2R5_9GAMM|nr:type I secretion system permease/ATPase [Legionella gratiana]KTD14483.1 toxin secretion ATP binding protein [Legionella gratiana]STX42044.1 toxin secretion ATP binding protein [Legionella gratiana]
MTTYRKQSWSNIDLYTEIQKDSLLSCLVLLTRYYQKPYSPQSLIARLPLHNNQLSLELFARAASRASLEAEIVGIELEQIKDDSLPVILLTKTQTAFLLILDEKNQRKIINPLAPDKDTSFSEIKTVYSGQAIYVKPEYKHTTRAKESIAQKPKNNWFWDVTLKSWHIYSEVLIAALLINLFALALPLFTMNVYDRVVPNQAIVTMWVLVSGIICIFLFDLLLKSLRAHFIDIACKHTDTELSANIFEKILGINMLSRPKSVGAFSNTVQSFELFRDFITSSTLTLFVDLPFVCIFIFVIYLIGGSLFWIPLLVIPFIAIIGFVLQAPLIKYTRESYQLAAEKQAILFDSLSNIETVKTVSAESALQSRWERIIQLSSNINMKLRSLSNLSMNLTLFIQQAASIAVVVAGVYMISEGELTVGGLIACTILAGRALAPMSQIASLFTRYHQSVNALRSLNQVMCLSTDVDEETHYLHRPSIKGTIEFQHVGFYYQDEKLTILKDLNFKINAGEKVAIIGRVGSGKSTLARLMMQLYTPTEGSILIDGTEYRQINPDELRQNIGYLPQDITLFYGSVRENITIGAPFVQDEALIKACDVAGVGSFTNNHPQGLDRQVGERGSELSGGQRQAVGIARSLLRDPNILILDEPTSAMDTNSERAFKHRLSQFLTENHTLILITHKISMLDLIDRIIILDEGRVIADGQRDTILTALKTGMTIDRQPA